MPSHVTLSLGNLATSIAEVSDQILMLRFGIPYRKARVLMALIELQPCGQAAIARRIGVDPAIMTRTLPDFVNEGLIEIETDPTQPRRNLVKLTASGMELASGCWSVLEFVTYEMLLELQIDPGEFDRNVRQICAKLNDKSPQQSKNLGTPEGAYVII